MVNKGPKSRFVKVRCSKCKNEQILFELSPFARFFIRAHKSGGGKVL